TSRLRNGATRQPSARNGCTAGQTVMAATDLAGGDLGGQRDGARRTGLGDSPVHAGGGAEYTLTGDERLRPVIVRSSSVVRFWHAHSMMQTSSQQRTLRWTITRTKFSNGTPRSRITRSLPRMPSSSENLSKVCCA